jgi:hypothetical protein
MEKKFAPLLAGVALFALASAANAGQPLTDRQMDGVTAGLGNNLIALANAAAVSLGNFDSHRDADRYSDRSGPRIGRGRVCLLGDRYLCDYRCVHQGWFQRIRSRRVQLRGNLCRLV